MNSVKQREETPEKRSGPGDYFEVGTQYTTWEVDAATAARIGRELDRRWRPRWIKFVDLHGGRAWVRTATIDYVSESTERRRSRSREFDYLVGKERRADRRWDADEEIG